MYLDEVERLLQKDAKAKARISPMLARYLGDIGLAFKIRAHLRSMAPRVFRKGDSVSQKADSKYPSAVEHATDHILHELQDIIGSEQAEEGKFLKLGEAGDPKKFVYPADQPRTEETVASMQQAENNLDDIWRRFERHIHRHLKAGDEQTLQDVFPSDRTLQRTPDFSDISAGVQNLAVDEQGTQVAVSKNTFNVFQKLFPGSSGISKPVPWTKFAQALEEIGFKATKGVGSLWMFERGGLRVGNGAADITIFFDPYDQANIPAHITKRYGQTLSRVYGLSGGMFTIQAGSA